MELSQITSQRQTQTLNVHLQQSMQMLQMNNVELDEFLTELSNENPLLELNSPHQNNEISIDNLSSTPTSFNTNADIYDGNSQSDHDGEFPGLYYENDSFINSIKDQINSANIPETIRRQLIWLCYELDDKGYLPCDPGNLAIFGYSIEMYENAIKILQSFEPAGLGARSLSECLKIQLERQNKLTALNREICDNYLDRLASGQLNYISKSLNVPINQIVESKETICALQPNPSNGYYTGETVEYIIPDIEIIYGESGLKAVLCDRYIPNCSINSYYLKMASNENLGKDEQNYFKTKLSQANWVIECITRRKEMILSCAKKILELQREFFAGHSTLKPMTMSQMAEYLNVHPSTVSRTVKGKYISCRQGVFPFSYFFSAELNSKSESTGKNLLEELRTFIEAEDPAHPLSDSKLSQLLEQKGFEVSRRTVAKYREEAGIPSSPSRKKRI